MGIVSLVRSGAPEAQGQDISVYCGRYWREESGMGEVKYVSRVEVEPVEGKVRRARVPGEDEAVLFGVHSEVAEHYGVSPDTEEPHASTLDYVVAAAGG